MEKVRPWCGQPSDRGQLRNRTEQIMTIISTHLLIQFLLSYIRSLKQIRSSMDDSMAGSVASLLVSSRLYYVNSILYGTLLKNINRFQRIQHSLARVVTHRRSRALLLPLHSSNSSTGFRLNGAYGLNSPL